MTDARRAKRAGLASVSRPGDCIEQLARLASSSRSGWRRVTDAAGVE